MILTILTASLRFWHTPTLHLFFQLRVPGRSFGESVDIISGPVIAGNKLPSVAAILIMAVWIAYTTGERMAENPPVHIRLSEAEAEVHSPRLIMANDAREAVARAERGEMPELMKRARVRRNQAYVAKLSVRAVDRLFEASGGHALFDASPMQRFHRDAHAASHHFGLAWETVAEEYGRIRLGLEPKNPARL